MRAGSTSVSVGRAVRRVFATATITFLVLAVVLGREPRLFAAAAACGTIWWLWDLLTDHVFVPLGDWVTHTLMGGGVDALPPGVRPSLEETIQLLESHLARGASRRVDLNAAIRLEEIYRTVKGDPERARAVIRLARERYPDAPELARYDLDDGGGGGPSEGGEAGGA